MAEALTAAVSPGRLWPLPATLGRVLLLLPPLAFAVFEGLHPRPDVEIKGLDPPVFALSIVGTLAWVIALVAVALAARRAGAPRAEWIFIALAGVFLLGGHPFPFGTIAFGCLFIAVLLHEWPWLRARMSKPATGARDEAA